MKSISELLLLLSNGLLVPDLLAALALVVLVSLELGVTFAVVVMRLRERKQRRSLKLALGLEDPTARRAAIDAHLAIAVLPSAVAFSMAAEGRSAWRESVRTMVIEQCELASERRIARLAVCVRLGPVVGLVGTLIPLGPGLVALSRGDLASMASHLSVAFTVTVVGLVVGAVGFLLANIRRTMDAEDIALIRYIANTMDELAIEGNR